MVKFNYIEDRSQTRMKNKPNRLPFMWTGLIVLCLSVSAFAQSKDMQTLRDDKKVDGYIGVALVIGNSAYKKAKELNSPVNDATDMGETLKNLGFKVLRVRTNATSDEMDGAVVEFERELTANKGVGVFYFSGHGVQSFGKNYLIPVDADIPSQSFLKARSLDTDIVLDTMAKTTNGFKIVILDACRTNPFAKNWGYKGDANDGLAGIYSAPKGTIIAYATSPNDTAADGSGRNSPYTEVLLQEMVKPGLRISEMFDNVRVTLDFRTHGSQTPWESTSLIGRFCFAGCNSQTIETNTGSTTTASDMTEKVFWQDVEKVNTISAYQKYLSEYPNGQFIRGAKLRLGNVKWVDIKSIAQKLRKYDYVGSLSEDMLVFEIKEKYGFIDKNANEIIPAKYYYANAFSEGLAVIGVNSGQTCDDVKLLNYGYINKLGKEVIPAKYFYAFDFSEGVAGVVEAGVVFVNKANRKLLSVKYDFSISDCVSPSISPSFKNNLAPVEIDIMKGDVQVGQKFGFIDRTGKEKIPLEYDYVDNFSDGLALVSKNGKMGFINDQGKAEIPLQYDEAVSFAEGLASVKQNGKWQLINKYGKVTGSLKENYEVVYEFSSGLAAVFLKEKFGFIDKNGEEIIPAKYDSVWCYAFEKQGFIGIELNGKKGFVDIYGNEYFDF